MDTDGDPMSNKDRLLFGSGFVLGVMFSLLILSVVVATIARERGNALLSTDAFLTVGISVVLSLIVGVALYFLAFPENALQVPAGEALHKDKDLGNRGGGNSTETDVIQDRETGDERAEKQ